MWRDLIQRRTGKSRTTCNHVRELRSRAPHRHVANRYQARALNKGVLDGFLLQTFIDLPIDKQKDLVAPIGTNRETIINDLVDLAFTW
jgi:cleavage and polyadenylation specificity factor subunit 1